MKKVWFGHQTAEELIGLARLELLGNSGNPPHPQSAMDREQVVNTKWDRLAWGL